MFLILIFGADSASAASNTVLDFDGANDYAVVADSAVLDQANSLSLSVWIEPDDAPGAGLVEYIVYRYNNYYLKIDENRKIIGSVNTDAARVTSATAITADGAAWTHIEMTYDKDAGGTDEIKLYINGVLDAVGDYSTAIAASDKKLYIGAGDIAGDNTPENWFDGQIDNPALYNYARSASDIRLDYNNGLATYLGPSGKTCSEDPASCMDYGLAGYWNMDEGGGQTAKDLSGNGNNGTLGAAATAGANDPLWTKGKIGGGLKFDGSNDYVDCGDTTSLNITGDVTITAWFYANGNQSIWKTIAGKISGIPRKGYLLLFTWTNYLAFRTNETESRYISNSNLNRWVFVAGVNTGGNQYLYVDGVLRDSDAVGSPESSSGTKFKIGDLPYLAGYTLNGSIDEVRVYNRALSAEEIRYHYNHGGPVAEWKFDEGSGATAFDSTENNNNGTLTGATHLPTWAAGKYGSALSFDGTEDYVQVADTSNLRFDASTLDYSLFAWTKRTTTGIEYIISKEDADNDGWRIMFNSSNQVVCSEDSTDVASASAITDTNWHFIGCTIDRDGNGQVYIDGRADGSAVSMGTDAMATTSNIRIGTRSYTSTNYFNGSIDEVRIYNYARTADQVRMDYQQGVAAHFK